ncbi:major facilitator superfamily domain-containing protein [Fimicolochytrium jonesii]|uniref:major facilitator superfamily domain-containing protein n=1 Tax=Fimicolochytrium jonesii TaxID=1396493 RepID=UPI0022FDB611|nr:major facilitator superfamily domain-containing protein [Fimicolochytrium jonesii]KAI8819957.1 major facilitator superfamily domain-containing protein [Fimicolochytrium jonesii]
MSSRPEDLSVQRRLALVALGVFASLSTAGIIFGFQSLRPALLKSGVYANLCSNASTIAGDQEPCIPQLLRLNLMFTVASTGANLASLPIGLGLDRYGPRKTVFAGCVLCFLGSLLFGISSTAFDGYLTGYLLLGVGGPFCFIGSLHISGAFPAYSGLIMAALTGAFDASSSVFFFFALLFKTIKGPIQTYFLFYSIIPILIAVMAAFLMPRSSFGGKLPDETDGDEEDLIASEGRETDPLLPNLTADGEAAPVLMETDGLLCRQLRSWEYGGILLAMCLFMLRLNFYMSSIREQIVDLSGLPAKDPKVETLVSFFNVALPAAGIICIVPIGYLLDRKSFAISFGVLWVFGMTFGALALTPNLLL